MSNEPRRLAAEYLKLLTTLSAGAMILVATFLRDVFQVPVIRPVLGIAVGAFALCVLFSARAFLYLVSVEATEWLPGAMVPELEKAKPGTGKRGAAELFLKGTWVFRAALYSFIAGIALLGVFVIWNLTVQGAIRC